MTEDFGSSAEGADTQSAADRAALAERRGEAFAEALYGILALHGPLDLDTRERLELGHFLCLATTDWIRARHLAKATTAPEAGSVGTEASSEAGVHP